MLLTVYTFRHGGIKYSECKTAFIAGGIVISTRQLSTDFIVEKETQRRVCDQLKGQHKSTGIISCEIV